MKMELGEYRVVGLDDNGFEVCGGCFFDTLKQAKQQAKMLIKKKGAISASMVKVEIRDYLDDCIADYFV